MQPATRPSGFARWQAGFGALLAASAVALSAYAAHAVDGPAQARLQTAAVFAFGHGVAFAALGPLAGTGLHRLASATLQLGVVLFCGSLVAAVQLGWSATFAPAGGVLMIAGWLLWAAAALRRP